MTWNSDSLVTTSWTLCLASVYLHSQKSSVWILIWYDLTKTHIFLLTTRAAKSTANVPCLRMRRGFFLQPQVEVLQCIHVIQKPALQGANLKDLKVSIVQILSCRFPSSAVTARKRFTKRRNATRWRTSEIIHSHDGGFFWKLIRHSLDPGAVHLEAERCGQSRHSSHAIHAIHAIQSSRWGSHPFAANLD